MKQTIQEYCKQYGLTKEQAIELLREQQIEHQIEQMLMAQA